MWQPELKVKAAIRNKGRVLFDCAHIAFAALSSIANQIQECIPEMDQPNPQVPAVKLRFDGPGRGFVVIQPKKRDRLRAKEVQDAQLKSAMYFIRACTGDSMHVTA